MADIAEAKADAAVEGLGRLAPQAVEVRRRKLSCCMVVRQNQRWHYYMAVLAASGSER
jgi:hypothetical protein